MKIIFLIMLNLIRRVTKHKFGEVLQRKRREKNQVQFTDKVYKIMSLYDGYFHQKETKRDNVHGENKDSKIEVKFREALWKVGFRYRKMRQSILGGED